MITPSISEHFSSKLKKSHWQRCGRPFRSCPWGWCNSGVAVMLSGVVGRILSGGHGGQLDDGIIAQRRDVFPAHVAGTLDGRFIVLFQEQAPMSRVTAVSLRKMPTASLRLLISPLRRSSGLLECSLARCFFRSRKGGIPTRHRALCAQDRCVNKRRTSERSRAAPVLHGTFGNAWKRWEICGSWQERFAARFCKKNAARTRQKCPFYKGFGVVVEAVCSEPVSGPNPLLNRELTGNSYGFWPAGA